MAKDKQWLLCIDVTIWASVEDSMEVLKKLKIEVPYDPAIPLIGKYPEKIII